MTEKKYNFFSVAKMLFPDVLRISPLYFIFCSLLFALHGLSYVFIPMSANLFFDKAETLAGSGVSIVVLLPALVVVALSYVFNQVIDGLSNFFTIEYMKKVKGKTSVAMHAKVSRIPAIFFEDNQKLDYINKAENGINQAVGYLIKLMLILCFYLPYFVFMGWYLFHLKPILIFILVVVFIPTALSQLFRSRMFSQAEDLSAPIRREFEHYKDCICAREFFKETRSNGAFQYFFNRCWTTMRRLNKISLKASIKSNFFEFSMKLLTAAGYAVILFMMYRMVMSQDISVGAFAAVLSSINALFYLMQELISFQLSSLAQGFGMLRNYIDFMNMEEIKGVDKEVCAKKSISFKSVSFTYPGSTGPVIKNVSFCVNPGETIALVGKNGSGKTTLIRLLIGLYQPDEGEILYDGENITNLSMHAVTKNISVVFQQYKRYQMTLRENIAISSPEASLENSDFDKVSEMAGVDMTDENLSNGYDTMLSREFDGTDVSGGQWQRIAIARGFFRKHTMIVLDEPTAAIDPLEETRIYDRFAEMSKGKTAFIITHRLGSIRHADQILVMENGRLIENGTYEELMKMGGAYSRMYSIQKQRYE